ncbi:MAG: acyl-CoA dehydrogenase family protein [Piscinibacter sp.]|uniref:acyl-CoA dehydrogenase family protein n=1 Tax=Piscinibacter TaxID=1114981 RepID=UPI000FDE205D|nr:MULTISPECIES: acyl-CoA dehydrogenase family protein [Piscinibacter]MCW5665692.1 acyl-CoA dehydrogenase family protein [Piscinibacter sp.]
MDNAYLTPEHELLSEQVARFLAREVEPHGERWEREGRVPRDVLRKLGDAGLLGLMYESGHGGAEADALTNLVFAEALSQSTFAGFVITVLVHTDMASPHLHHAGTPAQKARWMPGITAGRTITAVAITEPGAGSDVAGLQTRARRDGDQWVIDGSKLFITNGVHADLYFVAARTGTGRHDISMFAVEKGTPGFTVGRQLDKTGWLSSDTAELVFDGCRLPVDQLLGEEHRGFRAVMKNFQTERIALGAMAVGHCMQALALTLQYVKDRRAFGGPLFDKQVVRQRLAMLDAKVRAARQYLYHCAWMVTQGRDVVQDVSLLKALTGELVNEVVQACQQFHGGMGYMRGTAIERLWRDARILAIGGGASEVMLDEAAKRY